jgi:acyl dehydratase
MTEANIDEIQIGDSATCEWTVTPQQIDAFATFSSDDNPLHMQDSFAMGFGFPGRVAHGMVTLSAISRLIGTRLPGPGSLWMSQEVHFAAPVFVNDEIQARVTVQSVSKAARVVVLLTEAIQLQTKVTVLRGTAKVRIPDPSTRTTAAPTEQYS